MAPAARKFSFDTVFAEDGAVIRTEAARVYSQAELDIVIAEVENRTRAAMRAEIESQAAQALSDISRAARALVDGLAQDRQALAQEAAALASVMARRMAGAALDSFGAERICEAFEEAAESMRAAPRVVVRVAPALVEQIGPRIARMAEEHGLDGAMIVRADARTRAGDVTFDWGEGALAIDVEAAASRIDDIVIRLVAETAQQQETTS